MIPGKLSGITEHITTLSALSYTASVLLALLCLWGMWGFFPRKHMRGDAASSWLLFAIFVGFAGNGLNALYWRVFGDPATYYGIINYNDLLNFGVTFGDTLWKGLAAFSVYLHFHARWLGLPKAERKDWSPMLMPLYPNKTSKWYRLLRKIKIGRR